MKAVRYLILLSLVTTMLTSCSVWNKVFPPKYGCGTNGKNVGAEKLLDDNKKIPKAKKFKS